MTRTSIVFLLGVLALPLGFARAEALPAAPAAPAGFDWVESAEMHATFLKPTGWFVQRKSQQGAVMLIVSKEDAASRGHFDTGMSVTQMAKVSEKAKQTASQYVATMKAQLGKAMKLEKESNTEEGGKKVTRFVMKVEKNDRGIPVTMANAFVADDTKDTLYMVSFVAPTSAWDAEWKRGDAMLTQWRLP